MKKLILTLSFALLATIAFGQVSKTVNVTTAGTLSTLLTSTEKTTVTDLTVTGTINAQDLFFMGGSMNNLANLDLSAVNIVAYSYSDWFSSYYYPAKEIAEQSFRGNKKLKSIKLPNTLTSIGLGAFYECTGLTGRFTIPNSVTKIGDYAFEGSTGISDTLTIPSGVSSIGLEAFWGCSGLNVISIPNSVTSIGSHAFVLCTGLKAFNVGSGNSVYSSSNGSLVNKNQTTLIQYPGGKPGDIQIPETTITIGEAAFYECSGLKGKLIIPNSVKYIKDYAFENCTGITDSLAIPAQVATIGIEAFWGCSGLTKISLPKSVIMIYDKAFLLCSGVTAFTVDPENVYFSALNGVLFNKNQTILRQYPAALQGEYQIPGSVTLIGNSAFYHCTGLKGNFTIDDKVTQIGEYAFEGCSGLNGALTIGNSVTSIEKEAFYGCSGIKELYLSKNISTIYDSTFAKCTALSKIKAARTSPPSITESTFSGVNKSTCQLIVPIGYKTVYKSASFWSEFTNITEQDLSAGIVPVTGDFCKIYSSNGQIIIENASNTRIEIYSLTGELIQNIYSQGRITSITLPKGTYIVKIGDRSQKVVL